MFFHILLVVLSLQFIIIIHELGHLLAAKWLKYPIKGLHIGLGRVVYQFTLMQCPIAFKWLPLGGYVEIEHLGERDGWLRYTTVLLGGVACNIGLSLLCFWGLYLIGFTELKPMTEEHPSMVTLINQQEVHTMGELKSLVLGAYLMQKPMHIEYENGYKRIIQHPGFNLKTIDDHWYQALGLTPKEPLQSWSIRQSETPHIKPGDVILSINGQPIKHWDQVRQWIRYNPNKPLTIMIKRGDQQFTDTLIIPTRHWLNLIAIGKLGLKAHVEPPAKSDTLLIQYGALKAFEASLGLTLTTLNIQYLMLKNLLLGHVSLSVLTGPIGIISALQTGIKLGLSGYLMTLGMLSLAVALINVLPIPPLDGGHIMLKTIETLTGYNIPRAYKTFIAETMLIIFGIGLVLITLHDIQLRLFRWQQEAQLYANSY